MQGHPPPQQQQQQQQHQHQQQQQQAPPGKHPGQGGPEAPGRPGPWGPPPAGPNPGQMQMGPPLGWPRPPPHAGLAAPGAPASAASPAHDAKRDMRRLESQMSLNPLPSGGSSLPLPAFGSMPGPSGAPVSAPPRPPLGAPQQQAPQQQAQQQQQQPPVQPPPGQPPQAWQGKIAKSKVPVCGAVCIDAPTAPPGAAPRPGAWGPFEPSNWPAVLDVGMRADLQFVCGQLYSAVPPGERAVRRVVPLPDPAHQRAFSEFVLYLQGKSRAGVVKLPPLPAVGTRVMYLIPPSEQACAALGMPQEPAECMLALVVPAAAK
jgi:activating signal cointegrator complex subunit 2